MEEIKEAEVETEVQKAEKVLAEAEKIKQAEFQEKLTALLKEYGYALDIQAAITLKKV